MGITAIANYQAQDDLEQVTQATILDLAKKEDNLFSRENQEAHFTTSTLIISKDFQEVLLIHHKLFDAWTWTGGHNDGEEDFRAVALKEAQEETGLQHFSWFSEDIQSLDILPVAAHERKGKHVPAHRHLNVTYILIADQHERLIKNEQETNGIQWWPIKDLLSICNEPKMTVIYQKLLNKIAITE